MLFTFNPGTRYEVSRGCEYAPRKHNNTTNPTPAPSFLSLFRFERNPHHTTHTLQITKTTATQHKMPRTPAKSVKKSQSSTGKDGEKKRKPRTKLDYKAPEKKDKKGNVVKKSGRWLPGTVAMREIKALQKGTQLLIQKAPFQRLVRETGDKRAQQFRFRASALEAMQEAAEQYLISVFEGAVILQLHRKKKTLIQKDLSYTVRIRGDNL